MLTIDDEGKVGIGTVSPLGGLDIERNFANVLLFYGKSSTVGQSLAVGYSDHGGTKTPNVIIRIDGDLENTNNRYTGISDVRMKENLSPAKNYLEDLNRLHIINYSLISDKSDIANCAGISAQEVESIGSLKHLVGESSLKPGMKTLSLNQFVPILIKAVQELSAEIEQLKNPTSKYKDLTAYIETKIPDWTAVINNEFVEELGDGFDLT